MPGGYDKNASATVRRGIKDTTTNAIDNVRSSSDTLASSIQGIVEQEKVLYLTFDYHPLPIC
jgi:hypothetical protein